MEGKEGLLSYVLKGLCKGHGSVGNGGIKGTCRNKRNIERGI